MFCRYCGSIVRGDRCKNCGGVPVDPSMRVGAVTNDRKDPWVSGYVDKHILNDDSGSSRSKNSTRARRDRRSQSMVIPPESFTDDIDFNRSNSNLKNSTSSINKYDLGYKNNNSAIFSDRISTPPGPKSTHQNSPIISEKFPEMISPLNSRDFISQRAHSRQSQVDNVLIHKTITKELTGSMSSYSAAPGLPLSQKQHSQPPPRKSTVSSIGSPLKDFQSAKTLLYNNGLGIQNDKGSPLRRQNRISSFSLAIQKMKAMDSIGQPTKGTNPSAVANLSNSFSKLSANDITQSFQNALPYRTPSVSNFDSPPVFPKDDSPFQKNRSFSSAYDSLNTSLKSLHHNQPFSKQSPSLSDIYPQNNDVKNDSLKSANPTPALPSRPRGYTHTSGELSLSSGNHLSTKSSETQLSSFGTTKTPTRAVNITKAPLFPPFNENTKPQLKSAPLSINAVKSDTSKSVFPSPKNDMNSYKYINMVNSLKSCSVCKKDVKFQEQRQFSSRPGVLFCQDCYYKEYTKGQCYTCKKAVLTYGRPWIGFGNKVFHKLCLICGMCNALITEEPKLLAGNKIVCSKCFELTQPENSKRLPKALPQKPVQLKTKELHSVPASSLEKLYEETQDSSKKGESLILSPRPQVKNLVSSENSKQSDNFQSKDDNPASEPQVKESINQKQVPLIKKPLPNLPTTSKRGLDQEPSKDLESKVNSKSDLNQPPTSLPENNTFELKIDNSIPENPPEALESLGNRSTASNQSLVINSSGSSFDLRSQRGSFADDIPSVADILDFVAKNSSTHLNIPERSCSRVSNLSSIHSRSSLSNPSAKLSTQGEVSQGCLSQNPEEEGDSDELPPVELLSRSLSINKSNTTNTQVDFPPEISSSLNVSTASIENDINILPEYYKNARSVLLAKNESTEFGSSSTINHSDTKSKLTKLDSYVEPKVNLYDISGISEKSTNEAAKSDLTNLDNAHEALTKKGNLDKDSESGLPDTAANTKAVAQISPIDSNSINSTSDSVRPVNISTADLSANLLSIDVANSTDNRSSEPPKVPNHKFSPSELINSLNQPVKVSRSKIEQIKNKLNSKISPPLSHSPTLRPLNNLSELRRQQSDVNITSYNAQVDINSNNVFRSPVNTKNMNRSVMSEMGGLRELPSNFNKLSSSNSNKNNNPKIEANFEDSGFSNRRNSNPLTVPNILKSRPSPRASPRSSSKFIKTESNINEYIEEAHPTNTNVEIDDKICSKLNDNIIDNTSALDFSVSLERGRSDASTISDIGSINNSQILNEIMNESDDDDYTPPNHCTRCKQEIRDTWFNLNDSRKIHIECFFCPECGKTIDDGIYVIGKGKEYHPGCLPQSPPIISIETIPIKNLKRSTTLKSQKPVAPPRPSATLRPNTSLLKKSKSSIKSQTKRKSSNSDELLFSDVESEYSVSYSETDDHCDRCDLEITGPRFCLTSGKLYHPECFICSGCQERFDEGSYVTYEGSEYHHHCAPVIIANNSATVEAQNKSNSVINASNNSLIHDDVDDGSESDSDAKLVCHKCQQLINGVFVDFNEMAFHPDCFTCIDCGKVITPKIPFGDIGENGPCCESCLRNRFPNAINL